MRYSTKLFWSHFISFICIQLIHTRLYNLLDIEPVIIKHKIIISYIYIINPTKTNKARNSQKKHSSVTMTYEIRSAVISFLKFEIEKWIFKSRKDFLFLIWSWKFETRMCLKPSYQFFGHSVSCHTSRYGGNDPCFAFPITAVTIISHPLPSDLSDKASLNNILLALYFRFS
jgi:hypothetical protein